MLVNCSDWGGLSFVSHLYLYLFIILMLDCPILYTIIIIVH